MGFAGTIGEEVFLVSGMAHCEDITLELLVVVLLPRGESLRENGASTEKSRAKKQRNKEVPDNTI